MGLFERIERGKTRMPPRIMVFGTEGVGKSTLASQMPRPVFIQTEDGLGEIDCHKFPLARAYDDVKTALEELYNQPHDFQTVVSGCSFAPRA